MPEFDSVLVQAGVSISILGFSGILNFFDFEGFGDFVDRTRADTTLHVICDFAFLASASLHAPGDRWPAMTPAPGAYSLNK